MDNVTFTPSKACTGCWTVKNLDLFVTRSSRPDGHDAKCKACDNLAIKNRRLKNPLKARYLVMIDRCTNPLSRDWNNYGGRGVFVCSEWLSKLTGFQSYLRHIYTLGYVTGSRITVDRIDNEGGYSPENTRLATYKIQANNKRKQKQKRDTNEPQSGHKYITWAKHLSKWRAYHSFDVDETSDKKKTHIGVYDTVDQALAAQRNFIPGQKTGRNKSQARSNNPQSKFVGVHWSRATNKWASVLHVNGRSKHLGVYANESDAYEAVQKFKASMLSDSTITHSRTSLATPSQDAALRHRFR